MHVQAQFDSVDKRQKDAWQVYVYSNKSGFIERTGLNH
jgi:hypothetical protein